MSTANVDDTLKEPNLPTVSQTPTVLFILTATAIFVAEAGLMIFLENFREGLTVWQQALIDALLLIVVLFPLLYLFTFRPMRLHIAELFRIGERLEEEVAERRGAEAALRQSEKQLHLLSAQLLTAQEEERRRVALELHENLGQSLVALKLQLKLLERAISRDQAAAQPELAAASEQIDDVIWHIRRLSGDLSPAMLEDLGFAAAARRLVSNCVRHSDLNTTVTIDDIDRFFTGTDAIHTYRILQEALENVDSHAHASHLSVSIKGNGRELVLVVEDDGEGFDAGREENRGLGLATMYERARMLNSSLDLWSRPGTGTRVTLTIPWRAVPAASTPE